MNHFTVTATATSQISICKYVMGSSQSKKDFTVKEARCACVSATELFVGEKNGNISVYDLVSGKLSRTFTAFDSNKVVL